MHGFSIEDDFEGSAELFLSGWVRNFRQDQFYSIDPFSSDKAKTGRSTKADEKVLLKSSSPRFHSFLGESGEDHLYAQNILGREDNPLERVKLISRLRFAAAILNAKITTGDAFINKPGADSIGIPAGYTYLFQFACHDLVHTEIPLPDVDGFFGESVNLRRLGLNLETIFGGGPGNCPMAFNPSARGANDTNGEKLRLDPQPQSSDNPTTTSDLFRIRLENKRTLCGPITTKLIAPKSNDPKTKPNEALIADRRNEDNAILAMLTALFHRFYNVIVDKVAQSSVAQEEEWRSDKTGRMAREITGDIFRCIIRYDLLERILHQQVYRYYNTGAPIHQERVSGFSISREFAFAASRLGHSMVLREYKFNEKNDPFNIAQILKNTSQRSTLAVELPMTDKWLIDWHFFFHQNASENKSVNWARGFQLTYPAAFSSDDFVELVNPKSKKVGLGLSFRDMVRTITEEVADVHSLLEHTLERYKANGKGQFAQDLLEDEADGDIDKYVSDTVRKAVSEKKEAIQDESWELVVELAVDHEGYGETTPKAADLLEDLIANPPLGFFLLCEARVHGNGRIGLLGSTLLADTFFDVLRRYETNQQSAKIPKGEDASRKTWIQIQEAISTEIFPCGIPHSMLSLIEHLDAFQNSGK